MSGKFFKNTLKSFEEEIGEINVSKYQIDLGDVLPWEEVIGELNDFEKRIIIWANLIMMEIEKIFPEINSNEFYKDNKKVSQLTDEFRVMMEKISQCQKAMTESLSKRFGEHDRIAFRGNFLVVSDRGTEDQRREIMNKVSQATFFQLSFMETTKSSTRILN